MSKLGWKDRKERLSSKRSGVSATSSQDYLHLAHLLFQNSAEYAARTVGGNCSRYTWAGLPILLAAMQALVVEYEFILHPAPDGNPLDITKSEFVERYGIDGELLENFRDLIEIRNEIIHPAHAATGRSDNWPAYLDRIKSLGVLESTGEKHDFVLLSQIASHRLFAWAAQIVSKLYEKVILSDVTRAPLFVGFLSSFEPPRFQVDEFNK